MGLKEIAVSKSAKIVLSKSIFEVRNEEIFFFIYIRTPNYKTIFWYKYDI